MSEGRRTEHSDGKGWGIAVVGALVVMADLGFGRFSYTMLLPSTREGLGLSYATVDALCPLHVSS